VREPRPASTDTSDASAFLARLPATELEKVAADGTPYRYFWERSAAQRPAMLALFRASGFTGLAHVIDYGCHLGGWTLPLAAGNTSVTGVDLNPAYIESLAASATALGVPVRGVVASDLSGFPAASADGLLCLGTLQVLGQGALWHRLAADAHRVLRPHGRMLVNILTPAWPAGCFLRGEGLRYLGAHPWRWCLRRQLGWARQWVRAIGVRGITPSGHYYAVPARVVHRFFEARGFRVTPFSPPQPIPAYPPHAWFLAERA